MSFLPSSRSPLPQNSLSQNNIADALSQSPDNGITVTLAKLNISHIGPSAIDELTLRGQGDDLDDRPIERIALHRNLLSDLPSEFALLTHLRYLNLSHNNFSSFPDVLTRIPSLDTLDLSHNKIKSLPEAPGQLVYLQVFSLSKNKITRLPSYIAQLHKLRLLTIDRNPIIWPPKQVIEPPDGLDSSEKMIDWIRALQNWLDGDKYSRVDDDSGYGEIQGLDDPNVAGYSPWRFPLHQRSFDAGVTPHARSFSVDSNLSVSSLAESFQGTDTFFQGEDLDQQPHLHLGILRPHSSQTSPTRSIESYLPSPADSDSFQTAALAPRKMILETPPQHNRNVSDADALRTTSRLELPGKKSMPNLRTGTGIPSRNPPDLPVPLAASNKARDDLPDRIPPFQRQDSGSSLGSNPRAPKVALVETSSSSPTQTAPSMTLERNSYFRRLSSLPPNPVLPSPLLSMIDSARSILFGVCQIYQTLETYASHAIDDRLASLLRKVLDPANGEMMQLIQTLDRFDSSSRKGLPPASVSRSVVESCRDNVVAFGKVVGVLTLQLRVIATGEDVRYSRWILIELYAATAEISCAWQGLLPQVEALKTLLHGKTFPNHLGPSISRASPELSLLPKPGSNLPQPSEQPSHTPTPRTNGTSVVRTARRHAGSFSSRDVERGKKLPSYDIPRPSTAGGTFGGLSIQTHQLRAPQRQPTYHLVTNPPSASPLYPANSPIISGPLRTGATKGHSRQGSQASLLVASSSSSSPTLPTKATYSELPSSSRIQVDKEALNSVQEAVQVAPAVWDMIEDMLGDILDAKPELRDNLQNARAVTTRLSETLQAMQESDLSNDKRHLREEASVFLRAVVQLSNVIKTYGHGRAVSHTLLANMVELTKSTEAFAILLHVSSFSPPALRSHSPMPNLNIHQPLSLEEYRLGTSLTRSRSAQPSPSAKLPLPSPRDAPQSALPNQSFRVPSIRRLRSVEADNG